MVVRLDEMERRSFRQGTNCREGILGLEDFEGKPVPHPTHLVIKAILSHS